MKISLLDRSLYFKGLLLLTRKDAEVTEPEFTLMKKIGQSLGFESDFCETAVREILINEHIVDAPPVFSSQEVARLFIRDGITLGYCDHTIHPREQEWLSAVAAANGLMFDPIFKEWSTDYQRHNHVPLESENLTV